MEEVEPQVSGNLQAPQCVLCVALSECQNAPVVRNTHGGF